MTITTSVLNDVRSSTRTSPPGGGGAGGSGAVWRPTDATVGTDGESHYTTIQAALDDGATNIYLRGEQFTEDITFPSREVAIVGIVRETSIVGNHEIVAGGRVNMTDVFCFSGSGAGSMWLMQDDTQLALFRCGFIDAITKTDPNGAVISCFGDALIQLFASYITMTSAPVHAPFYSAIQHGLAGELNLQLFSGSLIEAGVGTGIGDGFWLADFEGLNNLEIESGCKLRGAAFTTPAPNYSWRIGAVYWQADVTGAVPIGLSGTVWLTDLVLPPGGAGTRAGLVVCGAQWDVNLGTDGTLYDLSSGTTGEELIRTSGCDYRVLAAGTSALFRGANGTNEPVVRQANESSDTFASGTQAIDVTVTALNALP